MTQALSAMLYGIAVGPLLFALALLGLAVAISIGQRSLYLIQYLFFLRYPLMMGALLALGPLLALRSSMLRNLFELELAGIAIVVGLTVLLGCAVIHTFLLIFEYSYARTKLPLLRGRPADREELLAAQARFSSYLEARQGLGSLLLALPLTIVIVQRSTEPLGRALLGATLGLLTVMALRALLTARIFAAGKSVLDALTASARYAMARSRRTGERERGVREIVPAQPAKLRGFRLAKQRLEGTLRDGFYDEQGRFNEKHLRTLVSFAASLLLYVLAYFIMRTPISDRELMYARVPALAHVLLLSLALTPLAGVLSFYFDKYRIPATLPLFVLWFFSYALVARDHVFPIVPIATASASPTSEVAIDACKMKPEAAVGAWLARRKATDSTAAADHKPTMVLVAASGGGITAAFWTARVLTALSMEREGLADFQRSITLLSSASGGGVGGAYFVDALERDLPAFMAETEADRIVGAAGASSLNETAFALAYHDLFALFMPVLMSKEPSRDRGWALEQAWSRHMRHGDASLGSWRQGIHDGWRPTQIFNATVAETGQRLLLSPLACPTPACTQDGEPGPALSFPELPASGDLRVVTAARLSATFPWVTPLSRPPGEQPAYHVADGGYYDNFGVTTALEWLSLVHARRDLGAEVEKVILVEIRAFRDERRAKPLENTGWLYASLGPVLTLLNVRTTSQRDRNEAALSALRALLAQPTSTRKPVQLESVSFELDTESPLSWHLSEHDRQKIKASWDSPSIHKARAELRCLWQQPAQSWKVACGREPAVDVSVPGALSKMIEQAQRSVKKHAPTKVELSD